jgi:hypothetical protein
MQRGPSAEARRGRARRSLIAYLVAWLTAFGLALIVQLVQVAEIRDGDPLRLLGGTLILILIFGVVFSSAVRIYRKKPGSKSEPPADPS